MEKSQGQQKQIWELKADFYFCFKTTDETGAYDVSGETVLWTLELKQNADCSNAVQWKVTEQDLREDVLVFLFFSPFF